MLLRYFLNDSEILLVITGITSVFTWRMRNISAPRPRADIQVRNRQTITQTLHKQLQKHMQDIRAPPTFPLDDIRSWMGDLCGPLFFLCRRLVSLLLKWNEAGDTSSYARASVQSTEKFLCNVKMSHSSHWFGTNKVIGGLNFVQLEYSVFAERPTILLVL
jgi:hypothetical protein